jgi:hypothetical protein
MKTRAELDAALDKLQADLPGMMAAYDEATIMDAFAGVMEDIEAETAPADTEHLFSRTQCMLRDAGLIPADDEPCSD